MEIEPKLKPLYANLKRLKIGEYLYSRDFELFSIENNFDETWKDCKREISKKKTVYILGPHNTEDEEEAFLLLMNAWYDQDYDSFDNFITAVLLNFATWSQIKLDYTGIISNLKQVGLTKEDVLKFTKDFRKIQEKKPEKIEERKINFDKEPLTISVNSKKIFVVHGREDCYDIENFLGSFFRIYRISFLFLNNCHCSEYNFISDGI